MVSITCNISNCCIIIDAFSLRVDTELFAVTEFLSTLMQRIVLCFCYHASLVVKRRLVQQQLCYSRTYLIDCPKLLVFGGLDSSSVSFYMKEGDEDSSMSSEEDSDSSSEEEEEEGEEVNESMRATVQAALGSAAITDSDQVRLHTSHSVVVGHVVPFVENQIHIK